jgi:hypothetical protein
MPTADPSASSPSRPDAVRAAPVKLRKLPPALLARALRLPAQHASLLDLAHAPSMLLDTLVELDLIAEAARLVAYALPEREAVWWACMCAVHTAPESMAEAERRALGAAEAWVRRPEAATRREAAEAGRVHLRRTPGPWAARAAAWSMPVPGAVSDSAERPAAPATCSQAVEVAVALAAARDEPQRRDTRLARFVASGHDIAGGGAGRLPREVAT